MALEDDDVPHKWPFVIKREFRECTFDAELAKTNRNESVSIRWRDDLRMDGKSGKSASTASCMHACHVV